VGKAGQLRGSACTGNRKTCIESKLCQSVESQLHHAACSACWISMNLHDSGLAHRPAMAAKQAIEQLLC
jgi:hypothetical protein